MVMGDRVNLRNEATLDSDVIAQVNYGDELTALEIGEEWIRVRPPATVPVWVHAGLLFEEREVRARVLNVRSGPGTQFSSVGTLGRGDPVEVLEQVDEWRRIAVPANVFLWISRDFVHVPPRTDAAEESIAEEPLILVQPGEGGEPVESLPEMVEADQEQPPELVNIEPEFSENEQETTVPEPVSSESLTPEIGEVVEVESPLIDAPENVSLVPLPGQGTLSVRRGWVKSYLLAGSSPSRFHLVHRQGSTEQTLCYLQGDEERLRSLSGQQVQVRGRDFWVAGQRVPLTRIESIDALETRAE